MKTIRILFFLFILNACLQAKKSPFDISSPSGVAGFGGVQFFLEAANAPPRVTSITKVSGGSLIQFSFSKAMNPDSLTVSGSTGTFQMLNQSDNAYLAGNISTTDNVNFLFRPTTSFTVNTNYSITILKTVTDSSGQNMSEDYTSSSSIVIHPYLGSFGSGGSNPSSANNLGQFDLIPSLAVDSVRNIVYMTDHNNQRVQAYYQNTNSFGILISQSGSPNPFGIAVNSSTGNVYYSEVSSGKVFRLNYPSWFSHSISSLNAPRGIGLDSAGNVYIAEKNAGRIGKYSSTLSGLSVINASLITGIDPSGVAIDSSNNIYVTNESTGQIRKYDLNGTFIQSWGSIGTGNGQLSSPIGIAIDANGYIYVAEYGNHRIQKFDSNGNFILVIGGPSSGSGNGQFNFCTGVAIDSSGNIYVADQHNNRVQKFGPP